MRKLFGYEIPSTYVRHQGPPLDDFEAGYLLVQYIDPSEGTMLSSTWDEKRHNRNLRSNLFKGLSKILLDLSKVPVPRIGSFIINDQGFLVLGNRPLSLEIHQLESIGIPVEISRNMMYSSTDSYAADLLAFHDNRLRYQPNAINDRCDGIFQASALTTMRILIWRFFKRDFRCGPFIYFLNDLHQSNILVDEDWNIKYLIDIEWACSRPIEMVHPHHWLTSQSVDTIDLDLFSPLHDEFVNILGQVEGEQLDKTPGISLSNLMKTGRENGMFWYSLALMSPSGLYLLFQNHIRSRVAGDDIHSGWYHKIISHFWTQNLKSFISDKLNDKAAYDENIREAFDA